MSMQNFWEVKEVHYGIVQVVNSLFRWCGQTKNETGSLNFVFSHRRKTVDTKEHACPQYGKLICANPNARTSERLQKPNP